MTTTELLQGHEAIEDWLVQRFAQLAEVSPDDIDLDRPFADYQLDSAVAVTVSREFGAWLGKELSITLFWEYPTIRSLAAALDAGF
ncbi:acyl carrier protein [Parachitinimonas caeni]|uniref:Acyl carrier protein n=1 Tax=Parachitinimonas caeni TaxID=3031301 RepID=A0ABT7DUG1_9NEIS|nr:acyl carrier protein [Parachitinimonas caeni]MDK2122755.1 acyl carrier protein [Parachitinimonas caeni]